MLKELTAKISEETDSNYTEKETDLFYLFNFSEEIQVEIKKIDLDLFFYSKITPCPQKEKGELFSLLMRANLIGNGTGKCSIGLDKDEKFLTLVSSFPYEDNYELFKESLEDFLNYLIYWENEIKIYIESLNERIL